VQTVQLTNTQTAGGRQYRQTASATLQSDHTVIGPEAPIRPLFPSRAGGRSPAVSLELHCTAAWQGADVTAKHQVVQSVAVSYSTPSSSSHETTSRTDERTAGGQQTDRQTDRDLSRTDRLTFNNLLYTYTHTSDDVQTYTRQHGFVHTTKPQQHEIRCDLASI